ncbi:glycosyltransferase family 2 protein [Amphritea pacifica]|uniref:Glycosyltransferase n=1 Tax=Amphritea pacifica TaxID=2811233 RepID=A0ABS2W5K5_9GAMM|nr:glycosyltransferase [Amphritea pacifica]
MKVSIITVCYNSAKTIASTIESVRVQGYDNTEHVIVDGSSSDNTLDILKNYSSLKIISEPDSGIYDAMNKGVVMSSGDIITILNSDDFYLHDNVLSEALSLFDADPELEVVLGDVDFVQGDDLARPVRSYRAGNFRPWMFRFGLMPPHPAVFIRRSAYDRVGLYKLDYQIAADFDFLTRLLLVDGAKYKSAHKTWVRMRLGGVSTFGLKSNLVSTKEMQRSLCENSLFANSLMLMCRLPYKFITQVIGR